MKALGALYRANIREFMRDKVALFFSLVLPITFPLFFGLLFAGGSDQKLTLGLVNEDLGAVGTQIVATLTSEEGGRGLLVTVGSRGDELSALSKGDRQVVIVLPDGLSQGVSSKQQTPVEVFYDPTRQSSAGIGLGFARNLVADLDIRLQGLQPTLVVQPQSVQSQSTRAIDFFLPSLLAMALLWLGIFGTLQPLVQQREQQVLRRLSASPLPRTTLLASQILSHLTVGLAQVAVFVLVGFLVFGITIQGSWPLFIAAAVLGALVFVSMGYFLAGLARTQDAAIAIAQVVNFPLMFLSGILFEPGMLPQYLRSVMYIMPPSYLGDALRQTMVGYTALYPLWLDFAALGGFLVLFVALGLRFFRWERQ